MACCEYYIRVHYCFTLECKLEDVELIALLRKLTTLGESVRDGFISKEDCQLGLVIIHFKQYFQPSQQVRGVHILGVGMKVASENTCPPLHNLIAMHAPTTRGPHGKKHG